MVRRTHRPSVALCRYLYLRTQNFDSRLRPEPRVEQSFANHASHRARCKGGHRRNSITARKRRIALHVSTQPRAVSTLPFFQLQLHHTVQLLFPRSFPYTTTTHNDGGATGGQRRYVSGLARVPRRIGRLTVGPRLRRRLSDGTARIVCEIIEQNYGRLLYREYCLCSRAAAPGHTTQACVIYLPLCSVPQHQAEQRHVVPQYSSSFRYAYIREKMLCLSPTLLSLSFARLAPTQHTWLQCYSNAVLQCSICRGLGSILTEKTNSYTLQVSHHGFYDSSTFGYRVIPYTEERCTSVHFNFALNQSNNRLISHSCAPA